MADEERSLEPTVREHDDLWALFSEPALAVVRAAEAEARRRQHDFLGTEHLLLGLLTAEAGVAADLLGGGRPPGPGHPRGLRGLSVDARAVRGRIDDLLGQGNAAASARLAVAPRARRVVALAGEEARRRGSPRIGAEHLLLGLLGEPEGVGARVLAEFGVDATAVRTRLADYARKDRGADATTPAQGRYARVLTAPGRRGEPAGWAPLGERMAWRGVPGVGIAVIVGGEVVAESYGLKEAGGPEPVTADTLFLAGSISKPVTAVGALRLVERGTLALDEDVNAYLRSWRVPANGTWRPRLTIRQLLSHTAGLTVHGFPGYARDEETPTLTQVLDGAPPANTPPVRVNLVPGTRFRYSGGGYCVLQQLMVDVLGRPFPELMRELVLEPAGMASSTFANPLPEARWAEAATGHRASARPVAGRWHVYPEMAAAGLWTTPTDLARFAIGLHRAARAEPGSLLSVEGARAMLTPVAPMSGPFGGPSMGLGLFLRGEGATASFGHGGGDEGFICRLHAFREQLLGAVVMTNSDREHPLIDEVLRGLAAEHGWPGYLPEPPRPVAVASADLDRWVGVYELATGVRLEVARTGDGLLLVPPGQDAIRLRALAAASFAADDVDADVTFAEDGLVLRQDGADQPARRRPN